MAVLQSFDGSYAQTMDRSLSIPSIHVTDLSGERLSFVPGLLKEGGSVIAASSGPTLFSRPVQVIGEAAATAPSQSESFTALEEEIKEQCVNAADSKMYQLYGYHKGDKMDNIVTRYWYHTFIAELGNMHKALERKIELKQLSWDEYAKLAFDMRHHARVYTRALMADQMAEALLERRDQMKYGNREGPTFEYLLEEQRKMHKTPEESDRAIVYSSIRTNIWANAYIRLSEAVEPIGDVLHAIRDCCCVLPLTCLYGAEEKGSE